MDLIIEPMISVKLDGQLHVLQKERIIIIIITIRKSNGAKTISLQTLFGKLNNCYDLIIMRIHSKLNNCDDLTIMRVHSMFN